MAVAENFFNKNIMVDEPWCFDYDYETKRQICEWVGETYPQAEELKF
jgi:hypothetical protein